MKMIELTSKDLEKIMKYCPCWVADSFPVWMADHFPECMADHRPHWMRKHRRLWMEEHRRLWMEKYKQRLYRRNFPLYVEKDILKILEKKEE